MNGAILKKHVQIMYTSTHTYPALLLTAVMPLTPVFSKLLMRFSGIPHNPKPEVEYKNVSVANKESL